MPTTASKRSPIEHRPSDPARPASANALSVAPRKRLSGAARRTLILDAAAELFAEQGFGGTTRQIATAIGVTQALLYRYFSSKQALIDSVLDRRFGENWDVDWERALADRSEPLEQRLARFYLAYRNRSDAVGIRLWVRAGLDSQGGSRYAGRRTQRVFAPIVREMRHEAGLPDFSVHRLMRGEREIAMALHASIIFLSIRKHVYRAPMPKNVDDLVTLYVRTWLPGALRQLAALHEPGAEPSLTLCLVHAG